MLGSVFGKFQAMSFQKFMVSVVAICSVFGGSLAAFAANDSESYDLLFNNAKASFGAKPADDFGDVGGDLSENAESAQGGEEAGYTYEYITTTGLNLNLIDRIPDAQSGKVGYIKELLSIYRDAQNGKIVDGMELSLATFLGMHVNEINMINSGGDKLPRYYFKPEQWKKETPNYCLMDYTSKSFSKGVTSGNVSESGGYGVFQHLGSPRGTKADVNPVSVGRATSPGDVRFLPDAIATTSELFKDFFRLCCPKKYLNSDELGLSLGICNNRGGSGCGAYLMGLHSFNEYSTYCNKMNKKAAENSITVASKMFNDYFNSYASSMDTEAVSNFDTADSRSAALLIAAHSKDWYIDQFCYDTTIRYWNSTMKVYKAMYPDEYKSDKSGADLKKKLKGMVADTIKDSIKETTGDSSVTDADCSKVYGTKDYQGGRRSGSDFGGSLWHVSKERDDGVYKNQYASGKRPYYIMSVDRTNAGYLFNCSGITGRLVYARLLKVAGVNSVDPTNPTTYSGTVTTVIKTKIKTTQPANPIQTTSGTYNGELDGFYARNGVNLTGLSPDRIVVLNKAAEIADSPNWIYNMEYEGGAKGWGMCKNGHTGWRTDCAHLCYLVYRYAGFKDTLYYSTDPLHNGNKDWKKIDFKNIKPADILCHRTGDHGHAVIYLKGKSKSWVTVVEAKGESGNKFAPENEVLLDHRNLVKDGYNYNTLRHKQVDKNPSKRKKDVKVPQKEGDPHGIPIYG